MARMIDADRMKEELLWGNVFLSAKETNALVDLIDNQPTLTPPNEPLTLDELRQMGGEPVWVQTPGIPKYGRWVIVAGVDTEDGQRTLYCQGDYTCRNYGRDWIAYRCPPEVEEDT